VLIVTLANPPLNFMNRQMVDELEELVASVDGDADLGAVVLTGGVEGSFVTHYDVAEIVAGVHEVPGPRPSARAAGALLRSAGGIDRVPGGRAVLSRTPVHGLFELRAIHELFLRMNRMDKVFIAAINGTASGGGCELALACDIRISATGSHRIGLPEMTIGFPPGAGGTQRLSRVLGPGRALEMMLEGRTLDPEEALELGLVHRLSAPGRLLDEAIATGERMGRRSPLAIEALKHAVYEGASRPLEQGLAIESKWFLAASSADASLKAMEAYIEQVERDGAAPWASEESARPWQEGTAAGEDE
jgi:enoyl-CoA hydratase/carnithine racemase